MQMTLIFIQWGDLQKMERHLNIEIQKLSLWFKVNNLLLNIKKTCTMRFSNIPSVRNKINNIYVDGTQIDLISGCDNR